jgi:bifunctional non-homologous end joining protein LigD
MRLLLRRFVGCRTKPIDGEVVALDEEGRPSFNLLQNFRTSRAHLAFFVFDVLILQGRDVTGETLEQRRRLLEKHILTRLTAPIHYSPELKANLADLVHSVKLQGLEGLVAKRRSSRYERGQRSGAWRKMRVNRRQEFVIGGYTPSDSNFAALIFGYYDSGNLHLCGQDAKWFHTLQPTRAFQATEASGNPGMPVCQPARGQIRPMGSGVNGGEDEKVSVA